MSTVIVTACSAFRLTVSEAKTEMLFPHTKGRGRCRLQSMQPARGIKTCRDEVLGRITTADRNLRIEITQRLQRAWAFFLLYDI